MQNSKEIILNNIKDALGEIDTDFGLAESLFKNEGFITKYDPADLVVEFCENLKSLNGILEVVEDKAMIAESVENIFEKTRSNSFFGWNSDILVPVCQSLVEKGYKWIKNTRKSNLSNCDVGITLADHAISETGTIVLYNNKIQYRNASLIAPIHVAILNKDRIVKNLYDLFDNISKDYSKLDSVRELSNCITFITGPSRTADIELNLTLGVHGPKELYVLIV